MSSPTSAQDISRQAQDAYQNGDLARAASLFQDASRSYASENNNLMAAEMDNNLSVVLLKQGEAAQALKACQGTDTIFAQTGDSHRQALALGNQAAACEALGQIQKAISLYTQSADLLKAAGSDPELRAYVLSSLSALQMKTGKRFEAMASMQAALESKKHLSIKEKLLKNLLKIPFRMMGPS
jgi:tetratricopeptide (TPR) repeat protein